MTVSFLPMLRLYRLSPLRAPALPLIAVLYAAMTADSARRHYAGGRCPARPRRRTRLARATAPDWTLSIRAAPGRLAAVRVPQTRLWQGDASGGDALIRDFLVADVFTDTPLEGNQLGIFPDGRGLSDELMLKATREMNFSETVFFEPPEHDGADAQVRIFTPGGEIPFAGHPTLGSAWVRGEILGKQTVTLSTGAGPVPVELDMDDDTITFGWMSQPIPDWGSFDRTDELLDALGAGGVAGALPVEWYRNGPLNVYVEIAGEDALAALEPTCRSWAASRSTAVASPRRPAAGPAGCSPPPSA